LASGTVNITVSTTASLGANNSAVFPSPADALNLTISATTVNQATASINVSTGPAASATWVSSAMGGTPSNLEITNAGMANGTLTTIVPFSNASGDLSLGTMLPTGVAPKGVSGISQGQDFSNSANNALMVGSSVNVVPGRPNEQAIGGGTTSIYRIAALLDGGMTPESVRGDFPSLSVERITAIGEYVRSHPSAGTDYPKASFKQFLRNMAGHASKT
jgi:hypothetical protein